MRETVDEVLERPNVQNMRDALENVVETIPQEFLERLAAGERKLLENHWYVFLNDKLVTSEKVRSLRLVWKDFMISFGMTKAGYPSCAFRETAGGGVVVVPFVLVPTTTGHQLYVGMIKQIRNNMGAVPVLTCPGGFADAGASKILSAKRELAEEAGVHETGKRFFELPGPGNPNRAFFVTAPDEGVSYFGLRFKRSEITDSVGESTSECLTYAERVYEPARERLQIRPSDIGAEEKSWEAIVGKLRFYHWTVAATAPDMIGANAAVSRLLAYLAR